MNNRTIIIGAALAGVVLAGSILAVACSARETPDMIDLSTIYTSAAEETEAESSSQDDGTTAAADSNAQNISYEIVTYTDGDSISIAYPVISGMADSSVQESVNRQLKDNALSILTAWDAESGGCTISIECEVPALTQKKITVLYTGYASQESAAYPVNQFYTNTIDLSSCEDLGLSDFADPYTMAGYVLSDDVEFDGISADTLSAVLEERSLHDIDYYTEMFEEADFPFDAASSWPSTFSYEQEGEIYFSIPVPHSLGDYVLVKYTPSTK